MIGEHDGERRRRWPRRINDLLLPIVKGVGSERSYEQLAQSLQTFGGSGFLQDYPIEQYIRDAKIDTLYEGTTAIQAPGLLLPQDRPGQGRRRSAHCRRRSRRSSTSSRRRAAGSRRSAALLATALADVRACVGTMIGQLMSRAQEDIAQHLQGRPEHHPPADGAGDLLVG